MLEIRGLTVSVNYADKLAITLHRNMRHMVSCLVVTSHDDHATQAVARSVPGVHLSITDAFTRHGAAFNKGYAIELSLDVLGREGWILIHDSDILFPDVMPLDRIRPTALHGCRRRILENPSKWSPEMRWDEIPQSRDGSPIGFFQLFHADDPAIRDKRPWYDPTFAHAGGGDAYFMTHWSQHNHVILPFDVLHLGPRDTNWFGTDPKARDTMAAFVVRNGWGRSHPNVDHTAVERVGEITERVQVPGYEPTGFELPFVQRARDRDRARKA